MYGFDREAGKWGLSEATAFAIIAGRNIVPEGCYDTIGKNQRDEPGECHAGSQESDEQLVTDGQRL
jgi:hypothetical protein